MSNFAFMTFDSPRAIFAIKQIHNSWGGERCRIPKCAVYIWETNFETEGHSLFHMINVFFIISENQWTIMGACSQLTAFII